MRLAVMGAGAVGRSVAELASEAGQDGKADHEVVALADSGGAAIDEEGIDVGEALDRKAETGSVGDRAPAEALEAGYDVLIEATPTTLGDAEPGFGHVERALERDRHAVLANKGPVAERYDDLRAIEEGSAGSVRFEATVGGAIPVMATIEDYGASGVRAVRGVLNGTANFILTRMAAEGLGYEHVLAEAQDLGVAEADPAFDVEGTDAALKCVIVANVLSGGGFSLSDAEVRGITGIPGNALDLAGDDGRTIRLIGEATRERVSVRPRLVPDNGTLAVSGTTNIVQIETERAGQLNISGAGAGGQETASAVLADLNRLPER